MPKYAAASKVGDLRASHLPVLRAAAPKEAARDADSWLLQAGLDTSRCKQPRFVAITTANLHSTVNAFCTTLSR